jgi:hypothetical protein
MDPTEEVVPTATDGTTTAAAAAAAATAPADTTAAATASTTAAATATPATTAAAPPMEKAVPAASPSRVARERKAPVAQYVVEEVVKKEFVIPEGAGVKLGDIPNSKRQPTHISHSNIKSENNNTALYLWASTSDYIRRGARGACGASAACRLRHDEPRRVRWGGGGVRGTVVQHYWTCRSSSHNSPPIFRITTREMKSPTRTGIEHAALANRSRLQHNACNTLSHSPLTAPAPRYLLAVTFNLNKIKSDDELLKLAGPHLNSPPPQLNLSCFISETTP